MKKKLSLLLSFVVVIILLFPISKAEAEVYDAQKIINYALEKAAINAKHHRDGAWCLEWVADAFQNTYGFSESACHAYKYGEMIRQSTSRDNIPLGSIVYFKDNRANATKCNQCYQVAGHIGIYVGNNEIVHLFAWFTDSKGNPATFVYKNSITELEKVGYQYAGWGWMKNIVLSNEITVYLDTNAGIIDTQYSDWGTEKYSTEAVINNETTKMNGTITRYKYFHYHNEYGGYASCLDSIPYGKNWDYCEIDCATPFSESKSFSDKGGYTSVKIGTPCKLNYTQWFEKQYTAYKYQTREKLTGEPFNRLIGAKYGNIATPTREGYVFDGWYTAKTGGSLVTADSIVGANDITLYAHWTEDANTFSKISLDVNGGDFQAIYSEWSDVKKSNSPISDSETVKLIETRTAYQYFHFHNEYNGYSTCLDSIAYGRNWDYCEISRNSAFNESKAFSDKGGKTSVKVGDACKLGYTYWFENEKVEYLYQTREKQTEKDTFWGKKGEIIGKLPVPIRSGFKFDGWYTSKTGGNIVNSKSLVAESNMVLYAHWIDLNAVKKGWVYENGSWYYYNSNGKMLTNCWVDNLYYVKADGKMAADEWVDNGKYYVDANGCWVPNKQKSVGEWKKDSIGWWYQDADGSYPINSFKEIEGKTYYFNGSGYRATDWQQISGVWYYFNTDGEMATSIWISGIYYVKEDGKMATNEWVDGNRYYVDENGVYVPGKQREGVWKSNSTGWWYENADGSYPRSSFKEIGGKTYYFNESGYRAIDWQQISGMWYYFNTDGEMATSTWISGVYYVKSDGKMATNEWVDSNRYYVDSNGVYVPGKQREGVWKSNSTGYWYENTDGTYPTNCWKQIDGYWYFFNLSGYRIIGWQQIGNDWYYFYADGKMASNTWVDSYYLDDNGRWVVEAQKTA